MSKLRIKVLAVSWLWPTLPISVVLQFVFKQSTPLTKILTKPTVFQSYIVIVILFAMIYLGFKKNKQN